MKKRAEQTLEWSIKYLGIIDYSLDKLSIAGACMMETLDTRSGDFSSTIDLLNQAIEDFGKIGYQHYIIRGLLLRAECYRHQKEFLKAWKDLKEAVEIAEFGSMKLDLCDYHLEAGQLCEVEGKKEEAEQHFITAARMVKEMGYWRRRNDVKQWL